MLVCFANQATAGASSPGRLPGLQLMCIRDRALPDRPGELDHHTSRVIACCGPLANTPPGSAGLVLSPSFSLHGKPRPGAWSTPHRERRPAADGGNSLCLLSAFASGPHPFDDRTRAAKPSRRRTAAGTARGGCCRLPPPLLLAPVPPNVPRAWPSPCPRPSYPLPAALLLSGRRWWAAAQRAWWQRASCGVLATAQPCWKRRPPWAACGLTQKRHVGCDRAVRGTAGESVHPASLTSLSSSRRLRTGVALLWGGHKTYCTCSTGAASLSPAILPTCCRWRTTRWAWAAATCMAGDQPAVRSAGRCRVAVCSTARAA